ncbi:hypothetical protein [Streptomyces aidingensis]|uniref:S-adenosyl methyltransferase n=1 Tax=Streptomyces aidingensis TaxID=910347 RepID=A0A1I1PBP4_9ACTN|nr:hypothetical protein [Streptomyces aidingensis]SFD07219.1 hypothetical protein SAMN05421773_10990 [Streptomyces aidingensis]
MAEPAAPAPVPAAGPPPPGPDTGAGTEALDALRLAAVLRLTGGSGGPAAPLFVLEAAADGDRPLAAALARCGLRVDTVDASDTADTADGAGVRRLPGGPAACRSPWLYDLVLCGENACRAADGPVRPEPAVRLARLVRLTGALLLPGTGPGGPAASACRALLEPLGMRYREFAPYGFPGTGTGFHVLTRSG